MIAAYSHPDPSCASYRRYALSAQMDRPTTTLPGLNAWLAPALATPAFVHDQSGRALPAHQRVFAAWACYAGAQAAREFFGRSVSLSPAAVVGPPVFAVILKSGREDVATIGLDHAAARAVVDAVSTSLVGLRGTGPISPAEVGLLEYAALELLDRTLVAANTPESEVVLGAVRVGEDAVDALRGAGGASLAFALTLGAHAGTIAVRLNNCAPQLPPLGPAPGVSTDGRVELAVALAPFALAFEELKAMQPGDTVLCGVGDLTTAIGARLVTSTLWRLCDATIESDSPTHVMARCGAASPWPDEALASAAPDGYRTACILVGRTPVPCVDAAAIEDGRRVSLAKAPGEEAVLIVDARPVGAGELVLVNGELGLRLNSVLGGVA